MTQRPYPLVFEEHDGSWTWSIEIGEPFEDDHRILARDEGYETRRDAQVAVQEAMVAVRAKLREEALEALEAREQALAAAASPTDGGPEPSAESKSRVAATPATVSPQELSWGIYEADQLVALFRNRAQAQAYAKQSATRRLVQIDLQWTPTS